MFMFLKSRDENTVAMLARDQRLFFVYFVQNIKYTNLHTDEGKMIAEEDNVKAFKGAHQGESGVVDQVHRAHVSTGCTYPSGIHQFQRWKSRKKPSIFA